MYRNYLKRVLDIGVSVAALVLLAPVFAVTAILVKLTLGSPVLFRQTRPGRGGQPFTILKFRTMRLADAGAQSDGARLTAVGARLRAFSLDELPELVNVLRGEMSLVGPRPLLVQYLDRYTAEQARRHDVRPGITGWAQVNGRNALAWEEKFKRDVWYVDNCSLLLDLRIVAMTVTSTLARDGIVQPGCATSDEFKGEATS
jgi:sugar transferase EpsL